MPDQVQTVTRMVKHTFTSTERRQLREKVSDLLVQIGLKQDEKKAVAKQFGSEIESLTVDMHDANARARDGFEMRPVECTVVSNFESLEIEYVAVESGEVVQRRPMTPQEKQTSIDQ